MATLREVRTHLRLTQEQLSEMTAINTGRISQLETLQSAPTATEREKLAKLGFRFDTLGVPNMPKQKWHQNGMPDFSELDKD